MRWWIKMGFLDGTFSTALNALGTNLDTLCTILYYLHGSARCGSVFWFGALHTYIAFRADEAVYSRERKKK
jgi:hypothetical protein